MEIQLNTGLHGSLIALQQTMASVVLIAFDEVMPLAGAHGEPDAKVASEIAGLELTEG